MRKFLPIPFCVAIFFLAACGNKPSEHQNEESRIRDGENLQLKLQVAEEKSYRAFLFLEMDMDLAFMTMDQTMEMEMQQTYAPGSGDTAVVLSSKLTRLKMEQNPKGALALALGASSFDSEKPEEAKGAIALELKKNFMEMLETVVSTRLATDGAVLGQTGKSGMKTSQGSGYSAGSAEGIVFYLASFSEEAVAPGDSWKKEYTSGVGDEALLVQVTYTYLGMEEGLALVEASGSIPPKKLANEEGEMSLQSTFTSLLHVDPKSGITLSMEMQQDMEMEVVVEGEKIATSMQLDLDYSLE